MEREPTVEIKVAVPRQWRDLLDEDVSKGVFKTRSELLRHILRGYLGVNEK